MKIRDHLSTLLKAPFTRQIGLESDERRLLLLMAALVATLLCAYTIAKVLRDALFLAEFGALALPYAYIGVAVAAAGFVWLESVVARRISRAAAARLNQYAVIGFSVLVALALPRTRHWTIVGFYIWTGSQAMMLLPHFWGLALDEWDSRRARTIFPLLGGCGLLGGLVGGAFAAWSAPLLKDVGLMWTLSGLLVVTTVLTRVVEKHRARRPAPAEATLSTSSWEIIRRSTYIKLLAGGLALSVVVSTLVDFQFKVFIQGIYPDPHALTEFFGKFHVGLNALALLFQVSVVGLVLRRFSLGPVTALQPITALMFIAGITVSPVLWAIVGLRWVQGVIAQTLGRSTAEIHYAAIHPRARRRIKPAIDTLADRWADAVVGVLLIVTLHTVGMRTEVVAIVAAVLAVGWLAVLFVLNRQYGRAFQQALSSRWIEPETNPEAIQTPSARKALLQALRADDPSRIVLALKLSGGARDASIASAVRSCLKHASPDVRAAAVESMKALRLADREGVIVSLLGQPDEAPRRAAVSYLLVESPDRTAFARGLLEGDDSTLRQYAVDALFERPHDAPDAVTAEWIDARLKSGSREDLLLAARAAGAVAANVSVRTLRTLLAQPDAEVQRVALLSAKRRPNEELCDALLPLFVVPELSHEAREAVTAIGDAAVPQLDRLLGGEQGARSQSLAARTLGRIGTPRAMESLMRMVRTENLRLRHLGLESLNRVRVDGGKPVLPRALAHKLFLRELADYRANVEPAAALEGHAAAEVQLLAASFRESAEMALERALRALACWYEPKPLAGAFHRLRSSDPKEASPALEYLGHILPRAVFRSVTRIFESKPVEDAEEGDAADRDDVAEPIRSAWRLGDGWLRACAVRASRHAPTLDSRLFATGEPIDPIVSVEIAALSAPDPRPFHPAADAARSAAPGGTAC